MIESYDSRFDAHVCHVFKGRSVADGNVLAGPIGVCAAANRMGARAACEGVTFKQTPYAREF